MRIKHNKISDAVMTQVIDSINAADDKSKAIAEGMETLAAAHDEDLINQIVEEANRQQTEDYRRSVGIRSLTKEETDFVQAVKAGPDAYRQSVTAAQADIIPTTYIDRTLADIKADSGILSLVNFAPVGVHKWLFGAGTGAAVWGDLTAAVTGEITATITAMNLDVHKMTAYIVVPKAIRELETGYVDKYLSAKLAEVLHDGAVAGYLTGNGKTGPIGIMNQIAKYTASGTAAAKDKVATVTSMSPSGLAPALKTLSHGGLRRVSQVYLLCNPLDEIQYVNPALYGDSVQGGYVKKTAVPMTVIADANIPAGSGILTLAGRYTMGFSGIKIDDYKETKALDDADVIIGKAYGNGRADDDDTAVVFDVTKLQPYQLAVLNTPKSST